MTQPEVRRPGSRGPARPDSARRTATASWALLAAGAVAAAVVIIALTPVGRTYGQFVASAFGHAAPTCESPGDLTPLSTGDIMSQASADGSETTYTFSGEGSESAPDLRMVCVTTARVDHLTVTTAAGSRATTLSGTAAASVLRKVGVATGRTSTAVVRVTGLRGGTAAGALTSVVFYAG